MTFFNEVAIIILIELSLTYFFTLITVPYIKKLAFKFDILDIPNYRKQHSSPIPRIGGIAFFTPFGINCLINLIFFGNYFDKNILLTGLIIGFCFFLIGLYDDFYEFSPFLRLIFQACLAFIITSLGFRIDSINLIWLGLNNVLTLNIFLSFLFTLIWFVGITNAINWIDGLDGLATRIILIAAIGFFTIALSSNNYDALILSISLIGSAIGFLKYNKFPAKIMMGDCGSNFYGFQIAFIGLLISKASYLENFSSQTNIKFQYPNIYLALFILLYPCLDMFAVIIKRLARGKSPFYPDRNHFHHVLLNKGFSQKNAVKFISSLSLWLLSIALLYTNIFFNKIIFVIISSYLIFIFFDISIKKKT